MTECTPSEPCRSGSGAELMAPCQRDGKSRDGPQTALRRASGIQSGMNGCKLATLLIMHLRVVFAAHATNSTLYEPRGELKSLQVSFLNQTDRERLPVLGQISNPLIQYSKVTLSMIWPIYHSARQEVVYCPLFTYTHVSIFCTRLPA